MATRQYIGARYVPKFFNNNGSSEWVSGVAYEALTIVTRLSNSYTSKKPVPASIGAPEANPEYWVSTGIYNQQVEEYRQEVEELGARVDTLEDLRTFSGKKFIFLGDSYNATTHYSWGQKLIEKLGLTDGVNVWNVAVPGCGFGKPDNNFYTALTNIRGGMTAEVANSITDVVVAGGANDWNSTTENVVTLFNSLQNYAKANFANAKIHIICCGWGYSQANMRQGILNAYNAIAETNRWCSVYHNAYVQFMIPTALDSDCVHPTDQSNRWLAAAIINFVLGGNLYYHKYTNLPTSFGNNDFKIDVTPEGYHLKKTSRAGNSSLANININGDDLALIDTHIGVANNYCFMQEASFIAPGFVRTTDGTGTHFYPVTWLVTVKKRANEDTWDLYVTNRTIIGQSYVISNVTGVYFNCDVFIPAYAS